MAAGDGLVTMTPTSVAFGGTSASINSDGGVDFSGITSGVSLNGVFTSAHDNYLIVVRFNGAAGDYDTMIRLRAAGSDNSTASSYVNQQLFAGGSTVSGSRATTDKYTFSAFDTGRGGAAVHVYGPYLAQPTAFRSVVGESLSGSRINDYAGTHNQSTSYDGFTLFVFSSNLSGNIVVFGYEE